jgi:preprotein translocase subunit SecF
MSETEDKSIQGQYTKGPIDVVKHMWFYIGLSLLVTIPGLIIMGMSMMHYPNHSPLRLGLDFTGGTLLQYGFVKELNQEQDIPKMREALEKIGISSPVIQLQKAEAGMKGDTSSVTTEQIPDQNPEATSPKTVPIDKSQSITEMFKDVPQAQVAPKEDVIKSVISIRTQDLSNPKTIELQKTLKDNFGEYLLLQKNRVGPTLAKELFIKAAWGLLLAYAMIVGYLSFRFQLDYAMMAIVALVHDTIFMLGAFSIMGWFFNVEVDSMFMTAILTVVGFSVHDTIVVFDRIRENTRVLYTKKLPFGDIVNISLNQTLARSINTSMTALLTLLALYFFGGESTRHFVLAMILGIITGTYSSIFVASSLLAWWRSRKGGKQTSSSTQPQTA